MSRGNYSMGKRQRESAKARKKKEKAERRARKREQGPDEIEIVSQDDIVGDLPTIEQAMAAIENPDRDRSPAGIPCRLFVGSLSWDTTSESLRDAFQKFGPVADCVIVTDRDTGRSRGFGFVTMADRKDAQKAIQELDDQELDGRRIVVNIATERQR